MIVEKNGYIVIFNQKGDFSLLDFRGQCIYSQRIEGMNKEKALEIIYNFRHKGIMQYC